MHLLKPSDFAPDLFTFSPSVDHPQAHHKPLDSRGGQANLRQRRPYADHSKMSAPDAMDFQLHARLFGGSLDRTSDLFPSAVIAVLFLLLSGAIAFKWFRTEKVIRPGFLLVGAIGMFANGLSFAIRAGASNTSPRNLALSTILAAQITLLIGVALMIDAVVVGASPAKVLQKV
jgi:hypothetical protein